MGYQGTNLLKIILTWIKIKDNHGLGGVNNPNSELSCASSQEGTGVNGLGLELNCTSFQVKVRGELNGRDSELNCASSQVKHLPSIQSSWLNPQHYR